MTEIERPIADTKEGELQLGDCVGLVGSIIRNPELIKDPGMREGGLDAAIIIHGLILRKSGVSSQDIKGIEEKTREQTQERNGIFEYISGIHKIFSGMEEALLEE